MNTQTQERQFDDAIVAAYPRLLAEARRLTGSNADAHDLVQGAIARALSRRATFRYGGAPDKWIASILRRMFVDGYRHARTERQFARARDPIWVGNDDSIEPDDDGEQAPPALWEAFSIDDVRRAVALLPVDQRTVYKLFAFEQLSYAQIAARIGARPGTIASRVFRARRSLRDLLLSGAFRRTPARRRPDSLTSMEPASITAAAPSAAQRETWVEKHAA